jgi:predicted nucleic acid-binding protein
VKCLIDTNILLDFALERQSFLLESEEVLFLAEQNVIEGYISASTFSDLYYIKLALVKTGVDTNE